MYKQLCYNYSVILFSNYIFLILKTLAKIKTH